MSKEKSLNKGIQADNVSAEVIAVGDHAKAVKTVNITVKEEVSNAITELYNAVAALNLDENTNKVVKEDIDQLKTEVQKEQVNKDAVNGILKSIAGKLKMVGVVVSETGSLIEPIKKIASAVGSALALLGI